MIKREIVFSYDDNLFIEHAPRFKLHKCPPEFPHPEMMIAHHPYFLDFKVPEAGEETGAGSYSYNSSIGPDFDTFQKRPIPKHISQQDLNGIVFDEIIHLINALTNHHIFTYDGRQAWTAVIGGDDPFVSQFSTEVYFSPDFDDPAEITSQINYFGEYLFRLSSEDETLEKRITLQQLLDMYFAFEDNKFKQDFLNACLVMDTAKKLGHYQQSASYVFLVSALETLIDLEHRNTEIATCKCCGQKQYQVLAKFRGFIDKYGWNIDNKTKNDFYKMRSEISHAGKLFQSSYRRNFYAKNQEDMNKIHKADIENSKHRSFRRLVEVCFAMFLYGNMQPK